MGNNPSAPSAKHTGRALARQLGFSTAGFVMLTSGRSWGHAADRAADERDELATFHAPTLPTVHQLLQTKVRARSRGGAFMRLVSGGPEGQAKARGVGKSYCKSMRWAYPLQKYLCKMSAMPSQRFSS